jgi:Asp/Glu/hydantoin racemase
MSHHPAPPFIGILMLDTAFPRIVGDAGNPESYPFPVQIKVVQGAGALDIVKPGQPDTRLLPDFIAAAQALERAGAVGIVSTCGFLVHFQERIAVAVNIPVIVSALSLYPTLRRACGTAPIGILTASAANLAAGGLRAAGIESDDVRLAGFETCAAFADAILTDQATELAAFDAPAISAHAVAQALLLLEKTPDIRCFLLECGNLPPYAEAIRAATDRPVLSILNAAQMLWDAAKR